MCCVEYRKKELLKKAENNKLLKKAQNNKAPKECPKQQTPKESPKQQNCKCCRLGLIVGLPSYLSRVSIRFVI